MTLPDVGVWLAAVWGRHVHHTTVKEWFDRQPTGLVICRITQMGLLRLLTNPAIMNTDTSTRSAAWSILDQLQADDRIIWMDEPTQLEAVWRAMSARKDHSHKLWTDDYLAAFAQTTKQALATLDTRLARRYPSITVNILG